MPTTLTNGIQLPDKGSVDWYSSMQSNYNLIDTHLGDTDTHVTAEDKTNWNSKQGSLSQAQLDAIAQVATNTSDITALQSGKANASHTHSSSDITDIGDYATKQYVDNSISGLVDNAPAALDTLKELSTALNDDANFATTVTNALSAKANSADLATVATSGDYDDLTDLPTYGITRLCSSAITDNSTVAFSAISSTDKIKAGDFLLDTNGKLYQISAVDTSNETVSVTTPLTQLAVDSGVMHLSGNESVNGEKVFGDVSTFDGSYIGNEASTNARTVQILESNRDTHGQSGIFLTKFRQNKPQGSMTGNDIAYLSFDCLENSVRTNNGFRINFLNFVDDIPQRFMLWSGITERLLGVPGSPWSDVSTNKINSLNPSALSFPDLSNGIDISGYITVNGGNKESFYTPTVNGWISVALTRTGGEKMAVILKQGNFASSGHNIAQENGTTTCNAMLPVKGGVQVSINSALADGIAFAYFYPCLGNV